MKIDPKIYLSRENDLKINAELLHNALIDAAGKSTETTIFSAYYQRKFLLKLFRSVLESKRRKYVINIIVGADQTPNITKIVDDLRKLRDTLIKEGFRKSNIKIGIFLCGAPFHTKLYYFLNKTEPIWFIGSANASNAVGGDRHELMVRLLGCHDSLTEYVDAVNKGATAIDAVKQISIAKSMRTFFLFGSFCYKPSVIQRFTFDAFKLTMSQRNEFNKLLNGTKVKYAAPQTEGFGFSLEDAILGESIINKSEEEHENGVRLKYRHLGIETNLGFWIPEAYIETINRQLEKIRKQVIKRLEYFNEELKHTRNEEIKKKFKDYTNSLIKFFEENNISGNNISSVSEKIEKSFQTFLENRRKLLADSKSRELISRRLVITRMPDIWNDKYAADAFERSFFEDVAYRLTAPSSKRPHIIKVIQQALPEIDSTTTVQKCLERRLKKLGWSSKDWTLPKEHHPQ